MGRVVVTGRGRRRLLGGHPWVYRDDVATSDARPGELALVLAPDESPIGWGTWSSASRIALRLVARGGAAPDRAFWEARVRRAVEARARLGLLGPRDACRLVGGDGDGVPGLVVDRYGDVLVCQSGTQGSDGLRELVLDLLDEALPFRPRAVLDRSEAGVRRLEDLPPRVEWVRGEPPDGNGTVIVEEDVRGAPPVAYEVDLLRGHKTGAYLDQRENRARAAAYAGDARVLDAFSYDGLFGIRAALAGAREVVCLDQSAEAGERCLRNAERNGVLDRVAFRRGNAMRELRAMARAGERFDLVVVDPPAFARNRREVEGAARGYRELNARALSLLAAGGFLVSASCSYNVRPEQFLSFLGGASTAAGREAWLLELRGAAPDHPALLTLPETFYLKCAFLRT